jgi:hypothetical protein
VTTYHRFRAEDVSPGLSRECRYHGDGSARLDVGFAGDVLSRLFWECRLHH